MNVGDYVRTIQGRIGKISNLTVDYSSELILCEENSIPFGEHQIVKSSPNIIDLIEVGDYVNGLLIKSIGDRFYNCGHTLVYFKDIKKILTKEQFESMEYKIGE